ncbi:MAG: Gfo/Idh/MocA family oxidoreductase [Gemmataceae bacterium]|nr:Gfo/Idh/MocA family oxidoreductase [Gemmataceae bacterium]
MALDMTPEQKAIGQGNFQRVVGKLAEAPQQPQGKGMTRRRFMQGLIAGVAAAPISAAAYFAYSNSSFASRPVKAGLIGAGDEGGVLVGEHNPAYVEFIAYSDIRPSNYERIFRGEPTGPRKGFNHHYGNDARSRIRLYEDYRELLQNPEIEMVVIALPLHLHAQVTIEALRAGKHVLCEKLMAWNISQCKQMIHAAQQSDKLLSIGHQRHYSMLYAHAVEVINSGVLGDIRHIRALWHRNNALPRLDAQGREQRENGQLVLRDSWRPAIHSQDLVLQPRIRQLGYKSMEELVRWRIYKRTGGGLMAELGSHQLDACSIFLGKKKPLAVQAVGGKHFYQDDREVEDHVYCTYEFPGANYVPTRPLRRADGTCDYNDMVIVTYSSISTNAFEPYGECVMGTRGTMVIEAEQNVYLWGTAGRNTAVTATTAGGGPRLDASASDPADRRAGDMGQAALGYAPPSRGYKEEMEHLAYCIRMREQGTQADRDALKPRCDGPSAMADAIIALTANQAMKRQQRIAFEENWFRADSMDVPDADMVEERI